MPGAFAPLSNAVHNYDTVRVPPPTAVVRPSPVMSPVPVVHVVASLSAPVPKTPSTPPVPFVSWALVNPVHSLTLMHSTSYPYGSPSTNKKSANHLSGAVINSISTCHFKANVLDRLIVKSDAKPPTAPHSLLRLVNTSQLRANAGESLN